MKTALVGTERAPLPAAETEPLRALGLHISDDPAQAVWDVLAAKNLLAKAGGGQFAVGSSQFAVGSGQVAVSQFPISQFPISKLELMLTGKYAPVLPEFMALLAQNGQSLPPEYLPDLLDRCVRDGHFFQKIKPALGPRAAWLAAQNPAWKPLFAAPNADWGTARFAERTEMLRQARRESPDLATFWLEKTWQTESLDHKTAFLRLLADGLSLRDEALLERAATDKNREVRWAAVQLLAQIPGKRQAALADFFGEKLAAAFEPDVDFPKFLSAALPDLEAEPARWLVALLPGKTIGAGWRVAVFGLFLRLLPPGRLEILTQKSPAQILAALADTPDRTDALPALLEGAAAHGDETWLAAVLRFFGQSPEHPFWRSDIMLRVLQALPENLWRTAVPGPLRCDALLENADSALLKSLAISDLSWSREMLHLFLAQLHKLLTSRSLWSLPLAQLRQALENAAYRCTPADAEAARAWLLPGGQRHPWQRELEQFFDVVRFREDVRRAFA
ncbi:MAG: DUF5691 domain-containing protein [Saprospiraceae bacterium]